MRKAGLFAIAAVSGLTTGGCAPVAGTVRELKDVGRIRVPPRLETWLEDRTTKRLRFNFRRYYPWYRLDAMGSNTPLREELFVQISNPGEEAGRDVEEWVTYSATNEVKPLDWNPIGFAEQRKRGPLTWREEGAFRVAEGIYTVNTLRDKVVVVTMRLPEKRVVAGYRAWRKDASPEEAKRTVDAVVRSLELSAPLSDLFQSEQGRPEREYNALLRKVEAALAEHGLSMPALGETREEKGFLMEFMKDHTDEEQFTIVRKLGQIRTAHAVTRADAAWSFDYPSQTKPQWLPTCRWYVFVNGQWESGSVGSEPYAGEELEKRMVAGFTDGESSYFFAAARVLFRTRQVFWLDHYLKLIPETEKRLKEGKLVKPQ